MCSWCRRRARILQRILLTTKVNGELQKAGDLVGRELVTLTKTAKRGGLEPIEALASLPNSATAEPRVVGFGNPRRTPALVRSLTFVVTQEPTRIDLELAPWRTHGADFHHRQEVAEQDVPTRSRSRVETLK